MTKNVKNNLEWLNVTSCALNHGKTRPKNALAPGVQINQNDFLMTYSFVCKVTCFTGTIVGEFGTTSVLKKSFV